MPLNSQEQRELNRLLRKAGKEPRGHYTGRCGKCGSKDLWDDNSAYGCNSCSSFWCFGS